MFEQQLTAWQSVYLAISAASATLAGLLFVALSLHVRTMQDPKSANVRWLAEHTFRDFVRCLLMAVLLLVPELTPTVMAAVLCGFGVFGAVRVAKTLLDTARDKSSAEHSRYVASRLYLSLLGDTFFLLAGLSILLKFETDYWMAIFGALAILLLSSTRNAWFILVHELS